MHIRCFGLIMSFVRGGGNFFYIDFRGGQTFFVLTQGGHGIFRPQDCRYWDFGGKSPTGDGIQGKNEPGPGMEDPPSPPPVPVWKTVYKQIIHHHALFSLHSVHCYVADNRLQDYKLAEKSYDTKKNKAAGESVQLETQVSSDIA